MFSFTLLDMREWFERYVLPVILVVALLAAIYVIVKEIGKVQ